MGKTCARRSRHYRDDGSLSLELVVVFPVFLLLIFGIVQAGLYYHGRTVAIAAAQSGAQAASEHNGREADGTAAATELLNSAGGDGVLTQVQVQVVRTPVQVQVHVRGMVPAVIPLWSGPLIDQSSTLPVERLTR